MAPLAGPPPVRSIPGGVLPRLVSFGSAFAGADAGGATCSAGTDNPGAGAAVGSAETTPADAQEASIRPKGKNTMEKVRFRILLWQPRSNASSIKIRSFITVHDFVAAQVSAFGDTPAGNPEERLYN